MSKAYHIVQWNQLYEKSDTRKTPYMSWYSKQTKLTGIGIGMTLQQPAPRNLVLLGTWALIETLASLSAFEHRGWLVRNGQPMSVDDMSALIPTVPAAAFQEALDWFSQPRINWLEHAEFAPADAAGRERGGKSPGSSPANLPADAAGRERGGRNSATDRQTDSTQRETQKKREREREGSGDEVQSPRSKVQGRSGLAMPEGEAQRRQFAAAGVRVQQLEAISEDDRTSAQDAELKKMREVRKQIQKKQAAGDFTPVEAEVVA